MGRRRSREFWAKLSAEVDRGDSPEEVARRHGVKVTTLRWWRWQLGQKGGGAALRKVPALLPVIVEGPAVAPSGSVEMLVGGVVVRFDVGTDVNYLARLADVLERRC